MELHSIGKNIRKFRQMKTLRQEGLAEKAGLRMNYVGALERGEKVPALETFIDITNALGVTSDMPLCDVVEAAYQVKASLLHEKMEHLSAQDRAQIYDVMETMLRHFAQKKP